MKDPMCWEEVATVALKNNSEVQRQFCLEGTVYTEECVKS